MLEHYYFSTEYVSCLSTKIYFAFAKNINEICSFLATRMKTTKALKIIIINLRNLWINPIPSIEFFHTNFPAVVKFTVINDFSFLLFLFLGKSLCVRLDILMWYGVVMESYVNMH